MKPVNPSPQTTWVNPPMPSPSASAPGQYRFSEERWSNVSENAKGFIRKLLQVDPTQRMTAEDGSWGWSFSGGGWRMGAKEWSKRRRRRRRVWKFELQKVQGHHLSPRNQQVEQQFFPMVLQRWLVLRLGILAYQEAANHPWLATSTSGEPAVELDASIFDGLKAFSRNNDAWVATW